MKYDPRVFVQPDIDRSKQIILTPEAGLTSEQRWDLETHWLMHNLTFPRGLVLDYGCGIGRMAKKIKNSVIGVDISPTMRAQAEEYVHRADFAAINPVMLNTLIEAGMRCGAAIAVWVLQHTFDPRFDIDLIARSLHKGGTLWVMNRHNRVIPALDDNGNSCWASDQVNVDDVLKEHFWVLSDIPVPVELCAPGAYLRKYYRK